ncbi:MAG TPA: translation elongation factor Ts [Fimbriimonadaceae bacterium]|nr:translation elongation factor Ts [Fimbriimonadaceae bacterium]
MSTEVKIEAAMVKKLRDETDAPMMDCKNALVEAAGDYGKAKQILREKGQAAAAKRAGRSTSEGLALVVANGDSTKAAGIVVECETDFVARNEDFKALVQTLADGILSETDANPGETKALSGDTVVSGKSLSQHAADAVAKIRENIKIANAAVAKAGDGQKIAVYNHTNTGKIATFVVYSGNDAEAAAQIAVHTAWGKPNFLKKDEVPQDVIQKEIEIETQRAVNDGKPAEIASKIAQGRVNKEYFQKEVLLEQPFYTDQGTKTGEYAKQHGLEIFGYAVFAVGANSDEE